MKEFGLISKKQLGKYKGFKQVDFRYLYLFKDVIDLPRGSSDCHNRAIINNDKKQYMTYCDISPFGKGIIDLKLFLDKFEVWSSGYQCTGDSGKAQYLGTFEANSFQEACDKAIESNKWDRKYYDRKDLSYWGRPFYDNEKDARNHLDNLNI